MADLVLLESLKDYDASFAADAILIARDTIFPIYEKAIIKINIETGKVKQDRSLYSKPCECKKEMIYSI